MSMFDDKVPRPTYIVSSGTGIHLYYVFKEAIPMFPNIVKEIDKADNFNVARAYICVKNDKIEIEKW